MHESPKSRQLVRTEVKATLPIRYAPTGRYSLGRPPSLLTRLFASFARRKWLLLATAATVIFLAALQLFSTTPLYRATAVLQVDPEASSDALGQRSPEGASATDEAYLVTQARKLQSGQLADVVSARLDLAADERLDRPVRRGLLIDLARGLAGSVGALFSASRNDASSGDDAGVSPVRRLPGFLEVVPVERTRLIQIHFESPFPDLSANVANAVAETFIERHLTESFEAARRAGEFLDGRLHEFKVRVEKSEEALLRHARQRGVVDAEGRQVSLRAKLEALSAELAQAEAELASAASLHEAVRRAKGGDLPSGLENAEVRSLESSLSDLDRDLARLSARYGPEWPAVKEATQQIAEMRAQLDQAKQDVMTGAAAEYELMLDRRDRLTRAVAEQQVLLETLDERSVQYEILKREVDASKELYDGMLRRIEDAGLDAGLDSSNLRLVERAQPPVASALPRKARGLFVASLLGLLIGGAVTLLIEAADDSITTPVQVRAHLGLHVIGVVPCLRGPPHSGESGVPLDDGFADETRFYYEHLRASILLAHRSMPGRPPAPQVLLVTSSRREEGSTTTAVNAAIAFARSGSRTLLLELDQRRPALSRHFDVAPCEGLSGFLRGSTDVSSQIVESGVEHLYLLPVGSTPSSPRQPLGWERMTEALQLLREFFTHIVIDSPPVLEFPEALGVAALTDGVVLVTRAGRTPRGAVRRTADDLARAGGTLLGVVLNDVDPRLQPPGASAGSDPASRQRAAGSEGSSGAA